MWNTALKFIAQLLLAKFVRDRMKSVQEDFSNDAEGHFGALKKNVAALVENHAAIFKQQLNQDMKRAANSLFGLVFIFFALLCSVLTALMWLFAIAWNSAHRDVILGVTMALPLLISVGIFLAIRHTWKKQPLFSKSMIQIESDWQVFKDGLDGTADTSDEANR
ncbi:phage holin family protein [Methylotenera versatilis]|uniref:phage holin family protein n=1 Tax=Methylotenera versatilis TaxID=1055487 RepID=UPI000648B954|nr:phage holin family protein [Methylotenera versatilis]